jgi:outer membrane protein assembly factor BamB
MPSRNPSPFAAGAGIAVVLVVVSVALFTMFARGAGSDDPDTTAAASTTTETAPDTGGADSSTTGAATTGPDGTSSTEPTSTTTTTPTTTTVSGPPLHEWVDGRSVGAPWGEVEGLLMFRGNPTNTWYGTGPIPETPEILWRYPEQPMCSESTDYGVTTVWCGNGWTGQPVLWERPDGVTEMIFGAYDRRLHFVDAELGRPTRAPLLTGDIIKGTPTIDPDGFPLVYFGSRDNKIRILALDRGEVVELWSYTADLNVAGRWNDDWDANPRIVNDILFEGSENSIFYIWKLNRGYDEDGLVTVAPELLLELPSWNDELIDLIQPSGYMATSVENSAVIFEGRVYFANSAGRVLGLDITEIDRGVAPVVFDYWVGDDVDASIVVDEEGMLYVSAQYERYFTRAEELGQLIKLDPYTSGDPYVWGMYSLVQPPADRLWRTDIPTSAKGGLWSTPALGDGVLYAVTNKGFLVVVDQASGEELWVDEVGNGTWSSPAVIDDHLLLATKSGYLRSYDISTPAEPALEWEIKVGEGQIEATPAVWDGRIYIGTRDGFMYAVGE